MKKAYFTILALGIWTLSYGQGSVDSVLKGIEENNPGLKAAALEVDAQKLSNRSEALLENPEIEFNYLRGGENLGTRHDVRVSQAFDIATLTGMKSGKTAGMNELAELRYRTERQEVLLEAKQACIDLVYCNAMLSELRTHLLQARILVTSFEKRIKAGDATVLDFNKAKMHLTSVQGEISKLEVERQTLLSTLRSLNGGLEVDFEASSYDSYEELPSDFQTWYAQASEKNPFLEYVRKEVSVGQKQLSIDKTAWMPELAVGYMSEIRTAEKFRGVTVGVNIPLWSNGNKVKQSRAAVAAAESRQAAAEQQYYYQLLSQFNQALTLKENSEMMRTSLSETDNREFLLSAQSKGEISMIDYLVETDLYYDTLETVLAAERDYRHALASLGAVNL